MWALARVVVGLVTASYVQYYTILYHVYKNSPLDCTLWVEGIVEWVAVHCTPKLAVVISPILELHEDRLLNDTETQK